MSQLDLDDRYGRKRKPTRFVVYAIFALLFALLTTWLFWSASYHSDPTVASNLISFKEINEKSMGIKFEITRKDPKQAIQCTLSAVDINMNVVGEITYQIPQGSKRTVISTAIPTRTHSVSASVERCVPIN